MANLESTLNAELGFKLNKELQGLDSIIADSLALKMDDLQFKF